MIPNQLKSYFFRSLFVILISISLLVGCSFQDIMKDVLPTPIDFTPPTFTATICPTIYLSTPDSSLYPPVFIVYLVEEDADGDDGWMYAAESFQHIQSVISIASEPGDRVTIFRLGLLDFTNALVLDQSVGDAAQPDIPETLTPWPTSTSIPTLEAATVEPIYEMMTATKAAATQLSINSTATQISIYNICGEQVWAGQYSVVATQWQEERISEKTEFDQSLKEKINSSPYLGNVESSSSVFEGLQFATLAFGDKCNGVNYRRCILVVFSDLTEYRTAPPDYFNPPVNLANIEVVSVMLNCPIQYDPECSTVQNTWSEIFDSLGAKDSVYLSNEDLEENLINYIRR